MSALENFTDKFKHFGPSTWSVKNKTAIYLLMLIVSGWGVYKFVPLPKEQFPDIVIPTIYVSTIYTGNSPKDIENLVTRPIEKQIKAITGAKIKKFTSTSQQDYSAIVVEFETDVQTDVALQKVKDAVDNAVKGENLDISGGLLDVGNMKRNLQLKGQFHTAPDIAQIIVRSPNGGGAVYLKNIATIKDTIKDRESYARLDGKNVVTLNIIKRSGENLIKTSEDVNAAVNEMKTSLPKDLNVVITGDLSTKTRTSFDDLVNSIIIGFLLVLIILMFFMGVVNAFFVALSVPLSMFVAFVFLPAADLIIGTHVTLNFIVLFALLFGLGIIVDDAIVVIENTHRIFTQGKGKIDAPRSAMMAAGEVFVPVFAGTLTTLAPFFPLLFWPGIIGKFMVYLPAMLIFTLTASLIVAFIMNPVFAVDFMNHPEDDGKTSPAAIFKKPGFWIAVVLGILLDLGGSTFLGNLLLSLVILAILNKFVFDRMIHGFQNRILPWIMGHYESLLRWALNGWRPA